MDDGYNMRDYRIAQLLSAMCMDVCLPLCEYAIID